MSHEVIEGIALNLLIILGAGLLAGLVCKWLRISLLVGYLVAGVFVGDGVLGLVVGEMHEIEYLARIGVLLLLFAIGIEFTIEEMMRLSRYALLGGSIQMVGVAVPVVLVCLLAGLNWRTALLIGWAVALSSTVLVFRALAEWGQTASPHGRRAIGVLLFQDMALVPLMLLVPALTGGDEPAQLMDFVRLGLISLLFVSAVGLVHAAVRFWVVPLLAQVRSVELIVLFVLTLLVGTCLIAYAAGLPPAVGAFAAGLILSGSRLSAQVDALILPYRESFAAIFFVSLGTLLRPDVLWHEPATTLAFLAGVLVIKAAAAGLALRAVGLNWKAAAGMGLGLAQLGEFSFVLLSQGVAHGLITPADYNRVLFVALGTLILTPQLLRTGLRWTAETPLAEPPTHGTVQLPEGSSQAVVVGLGPIGRQVSSLLETRGMDVCLVDASPVNLYPFAQQGFRNVSGDATEPAVLERADIRHCQLCVVTVPDDSVARQIVATVRRLNRTCTVVVRCRFQTNVDTMVLNGATAVVSEESEATGALLRVLEPATSRSTPEEV